MYNNNVLLRVLLTFGGSKLKSVASVYCTIQSDNSISVSEVHKKTGAKLVFSGIMGWNLGTAPFVSFPNPAPQATKPTFDKFVDAQLFLIASQTF